MITYETLEQARQGATSRLADQLSAGARELRSWAEAVAELDRYQSGSSGVAEVAAFLDEQARRAELAVRPELTVDPR